MHSEQRRPGYGMTLSACLWLGLFPLLQGGTYARLTYDKWIIMLILAGVTLVCFLFDRLHEKFLLRGGLSFFRSCRPGVDCDVASPGTVCSRLGKARCLPFFLAAALLFWTVLSCLSSSYGPETWWLGEAARREGLATQLCYFFIFVCFFFSRVNLKPVLLSASAGVTVFFAIVMLQRGGGNPLGLFPSGRSYALNPEFQGTIGNIDMGTGYLVLLSGFFLYWILNAVCRNRNTSSGGHTGLTGVGSGKKALSQFISIFAGITGFVLSLFLILTMGVQFGMISIAVLVLFTLLRFIPKKLRLSLLILLIVLALLIVWFWPAQGGGLWELHEIFHGRARLSFGSNRIAVWYYSLQMAGSNLLLGGGSGTFAFRFSQFLADHDYVIPREQDGLPLPDYFDNPHNEYIAQLTDHGLPAMLIFAAFLIVSVFRRREGWFPVLAPCSSAVLCYMVQAFFSFSVCIVAPVFWVLFALSFNE